MAASKYLAKLSENNCEENHSSAEAYSERCRTSKMELFV